MEHCRTRDGRRNYANAKIASGFGPRSVWSLNLVVLTLQIWKRCKVEIAAPFNPEFGSKTCPFDDLANDVINMQFPSLQCGQEERSVQENVRSNFQEEEGRGKCREMSSAFQEDGNKQFSDAGSLCKNVIRRLTTCKVSCPKIPVHSHSPISCMFPLYPLHFHSYGAAF